MCGIAGYVGGNFAEIVVVDGLKRLEYRGYDSAGLAVPLDGHGSSPSFSCCPSSSWPITRRVLKGSDADQPRNLAKSVTVE